MNRPLAFNLEVFEQRLDEIRRLQSEQPSQALEMLTDLLKIEDLSDDNRGQIHFECGYILKTFSIKRTKHC